MDELIKLGLRIKTLRRLQGDSQEKLSEKIDRTVSAFSTLERGETRKSRERNPGHPELIPESPAEPIKSHPENPGFRVWISLDGGCRLREMVPEASINF
jgi:hypothetical protein